MKIKKALCLWAILMAPQAYSSPEAWVQPPKDPFLEQISFAIPKLVRFSRKGNRYEPDEPRRIANPNGPRMSDTYLLVYNARIKALQEARWNEEQAIAKAQKDKQQAMLAQRIPRPK